MQIGVLEILYYRNPKGAVAISLDEGVTVVIPSGRRLPTTEVWEETDEDNLEELLTEHQVQVLADFRSRPALTGLDLMAWRLGQREKAAFAKGYAQSELTYRHRTIKESARVVSSDPED